MPEAQLIKYSFKELATLMIKDRDIHEGHWGIYARFGISAGNVGASDESLLPAAIVPILELGLQKFDGPSPLAVDAATVWERK